MTRRELLSAAAMIAGAGTGREFPVVRALAPPQTLLKPRRLRPGDTVGVVTPATATFQQVELDIVTESLTALGLKVKIGEHVRDRHGSLGGSDKDRAADINKFFADSSVRAIFPTRGGWGSSRLLPLLDYDSIRRNPKIILGYSDITALLNAIHAKTGLITFHGPNGGGRWDQPSLDWMKQVLFDGQAVTYANPKTSNDRNVLTQIENRTQKIHGGKAKGKLLGGNLTVFTAIMGSPYVPNIDGAIFFTEDVDEAYYRIDRMMTQLAIAGVLGKIRGFIFGTCSECKTGDGYASFTLEEIFADHVAPLNIPSWSGAMIGHSMTQWTLPVGLDVEIDADAATLRMTEAAVV